MTRSEALNKGLTRYFTGNPCKRGHLADRNAITASCYRCLAEYQKKSKQRLHDNWAKQAKGFREMTIKVPNEAALIVRDFEELLGKLELYPGRYDRPFDFCNNYFSKVFSAVENSTEQSFKDLIAALENVDNYFAAVLQAIDLTNNG
jgi:hypothetical protein